MGADWALRLPILAHEVQTMVPGTYVYRNHRRNPCFTVEAQDIDSVIELLRVRGITARMRPAPNNLTEFEFVGRAPARIYLLLEELRQHAH